MTDTPAPRSAPPATTPAASARLAGRLALGADGHESGAAIPKIPTGIGGFDHVSMGGLPLRRTTVVAGPAGAAKTLFAGQFLAEGVRRGEPGVFVTLEEPAVDLRGNFATLGWDVQAWEGSGDWRFVDGSPLTPPDADRRPDYSVETLSAQIGAAVDRTGARRLVLDSLSAVLSLHADPVMARQVLRTLIVRLRAMDLTVVLTVETEDDPDGSLSRWGVEEFVADNVVLLRNIREGIFRRRTVEVLKMRGAMHHKGDVPFTIVPGEGLRVLPIAASAPASRRGPRERLPSGVAGLDAMTRGGVFRGSTTLVSGPTGSGKTMMATQFAVDGVRAGETVLFMAYEESHDQVLANGAALGCAFAGEGDDGSTPRPEGEGVVHVRSLYPEVASLDDHLVEFHALVQRLQPTRVVLDGLSALERLGSPQSYRGFLLGVTAFVSSAGLAAVITTTPPVPTPVTPTADDLTGLVDTVVVLRHHEAGATVHRGIRIQRMRGSRHDNTVRELLIDDHGVAVGGPLPENPGRTPVP
jgi:circadian clock protein KaiC